MPELEELGGLAQTEVVVIPVIDVSGSMYGERIASVNEAMSEVPAQLAEINEDSLDGKLLIAPMEFATGARWFDIQDKPEEVENYVWRDMKANGLTDLGAACDLLYEKLTTEEKGGWMKGRGGAAPVIILISDGGPTDDYKKSLDRLKTRGWFRAAIKFAVAVEGADKSVLAEFTGNMESVIDTTVIRTDLASIVKKVVVSASKTASQSASIGNTVAKGNTVTSNDGAIVNQQAQQQAAAAVGQALTMDDTDNLF